MGIQWEAVEPNVWKPKQPGDRIEGILMDKRIGVGINKSNVYHILTSEGEITVFGTKIIDDRLAYFKEDDHIRIEYKGQEKNKLGQPLNIYKVEKGIDKPDKFEVKFNTAGVKLL